MSIKHTYFIAIATLIVVGCGGSSQTNYEQPNEDLLTVSIHEGNATQISNVIGLTPAFIEEYLKELTITINNNLSQSNSAIIIDESGNQVSEIQNRDSLLTHRETVQSDTLRENNCNTSGKVTIEKHITYDLISFLDCVVTTQDETEEFPITSTTRTNGVIKVSDNTELSVDYPGAKSIGFDLSEDHEDGYGNTSSTTTQGSFSSGFNSKSYIVNDFNVKSQHLTQYADGSKDDYSYDVRNYNTRTDFTTRPDSDGIFPSSFNGYISSKGFVSTHELSSNEYNPIFGGMVHIQGVITDFFHNEYKVSGSGESELITRKDLKGLHKSINGSAFRFEPWDFDEESELSQGLQQLSAAKITYQ